MLDIVPMTQTKCGMYILKTCFKKIVQMEGTLFSITFHLHFANISKNVIAFHVGILFFKMFDLFFSCYLVCTPYVSQEKIKLEHVFTLNKAPQQQALPNFSLHIMQALILVKTYYFGLYLTLNSDILEVLDLLGSLVVDFDLWKLLFMKIKNSSNMSNF